MKLIFTLAVKSAEVSGPSSSQCLRWKNQDSSLLNNLTKGTEECCTVDMNMEVKGIY